MSLYLTVTFIYICIIYAAYGDMFPHKHKPPIPFPIPGWDPDSKPWDESLYPAFKQELTRKHGNSRVKYKSTFIRSLCKLWHANCAMFSQVKFPECVSRATVLRWTARASHSLQRWSSRRARKRTLTATWCMTNTVTTFWRRRQVLSIWSFNKTKIH